jgi:hypothetical protein
MEVLEPRMFKKPDNIREWMKAIDSNHSRKYRQRSGASGTRYFAIPPNSF